MPNDVDVSSYKSSDGPAPIDLATKLGAAVQQQQNIQRGDIAISSDQLKLMNERWGFIHKDLTTLLSDPEVANGGPNALNKVKATLGNHVKMGFIPPQMADEFIKTLPTDPKKVPQAIYQSVLRGQDINSAINTHFGAPGEMKTGNATIPVTRSAIFGTRSTGEPIPDQLPPGTEKTVNGQKQLLDVQSPVAPPGMVTAPPARPSMPGVNNLPVQQPNFNDRFSQTQPNTVKTERVINTSNPPMYDEGKAQYAKEQQRAVDTLGAVQPVIKAYHMLDDLRSGPGTQTWNNALAFLKANNIVSTDAKDPTAIYQEVNKYLSQRIQSSGSRSDAALAGAEVSNPNVGKQILPALKNLTKNAIVMDRKRSLVPISFEGRTDFDKFGEHSTKVQSSLDDRALAIDLLKPDERNKLIDDMVKKEKTLEGKKFWNTIRLLDKHQLVDTSTAND